MKVLYVGQTRSGEALRDRLPFDAVSIAETPDLLASALASPSFGLVVLDGRSGPYPGLRSVLEQHWPPVPVWILGALGPVVEVPSPDGSRLEPEAAKRIESVLPPRGARESLLDPRLGDLLPIGVFRADARGGCLWVNSHWSDITGLSPEEAVGTGWSRALHPDDAERVSAAWAHAVASRTSFADEYRFRRPDSRVTWVLGRASWDESDGTWAGTVTDITELKRLEAEHVELLESERRLRAEAEVARDRLEGVSHVMDAALTHVGIDELLSDLLARIRDTVRSDSAAILLMSGDGTELTVRAIRGVGEGGAESARIPIGRAIAGGAIDRHEVVVVDLNDVDTVRLYLRGALRSLAAVPLLLGERCIGVLEVATREPHEFSEADLTLLRLVAARAALAIDRARLYEELHEGEARLRSLSRRLVDLQEQERRRLARELHDDVGQLLTGLKFLLESPSGPLGGPSSPREERKRLVQELLERIRALSTSLRPPMLDDLGLLPTVHWHIEQVRVATGIVVDFHHADVGSRFHPDLELAAFRIVQESLTNVARHAGVDKARVRLWSNGEHLGIRIEDEGRGFDVEAALRGPTSGLAGMLERARLLGGSLSIDSAPGAGTRIIAEIPIPDQSTGPA